MDKLNTAPAFKTAILFSTGIIAGRFPGDGLHFIVLLLILTGAAIFIFRKNDNLRAVLLFALVVIMGMIKSNIDFRIFESKTINLTGKNLSNVFLTGIIDDLPEYSKERIRFTLEASEIISRNDTLNTDGRVLVTVKQKKQLTENDTMPLFEAGDGVILYGTLRDAPEETNPGDFNYREYLAMNDINKTFRVNYYDEAEVVSKGNLNFFEQKIVYPVRKFAIENIDDKIGGEEGAFLNGLVTGYRSDMPKELKEDFIKAGVMHLVAVSGLNVAYIILFLTGIFSLFRIPAKVRIYFILAALIFYVFFTGAPASIVRAAIMGGVLLINLRVQRKINFYNTAGISALLILMYNSMQLFNPGFILSYSSVISLVFIYNKVDKYIGYRIDRINRRVRKGAYYLYATLLTTAAAQIGVLPITLMYFGKISVSGLFTNIIVIPASNFSLALGFVQIITGVFSEFISGLFASVNYYLLHYQIMFIKWAAGISFSSIEYYGITISGLIVFYIILLLAAQASKSNIKYTASTAVIVLILYFTFSGYRESRLEAIYLSLGNADCTHLRTPDGSNILIDAGIENRFNRITTGRILPYLKKQGVKEIDLLILTSETGKNYGALKTILENLDVRKIILPLKSEIRGKSEEIIIEKKIQVEELKNMKDVKGYGGIRIEFFNSDTPAGMVKVIYGERSFLFTGKAESIDEAGIAAVFGERVKADVMKAAKYGSRKSNSEEFIKAVKPEIVVVSTSGNKERNMPADEVMERFARNNVKIFRTDEEGAVIIKTDGKEITAD